jgi:hypothetical protein
VSAPALLAAPISRGSRGSSLVASTGCLDLVARVVRLERVRFRVLALIESAPVATAPRTHAADARPVRPAPKPSRPVLDGRVNVEPKFKWRDL